MTEPRTSQTSGLRLWHDDVRQPPDGSWVWAQTNAQAVALLATGDVVEASLDHDLGMENGLVLVKWMCEAGYVPEKVTIHSWNPSGARRMAAVLEDHGHRCVVEPFRIAA